MATKPAADADSDGAPERPRISDKVQFWEEQDRINHELIPRVLKIHEILSEHVAAHDAASMQLAKLEARLTHRIRVVRLQAAMVGGTAIVVALASAAATLLLA